MKAKWKITIGIVALFAILIFVSYFFLWSGNKYYTQDIIKELKEDDKYYIDIIEKLKKDITLDETEKINEVEKLLNRMEFGTIAFNAPTNINIKESPKIQLLLSLAETVEKLKKSITEKGKKIGAEIRVSSQMKAVLSGNMFQILKLSDEKQLVSKSQQTKWKWEIHPKKEGRHNLHLTLSAILEINGKDTLRTIKTCEKIIEVNVTPIQKFEIFFKNNWQWLWAAILAPVAGWLWGIKKKQLTTHPTDN